MKNAGWAAVLTNGKLHYLEPEPDARCEFSYYVLCGGWTLSSPAQFIANPVPETCCKRCVKKQAARAAGRASE